jgi:hypothetical protein
MPLVGVRTKVRFPVILGVFPGWLLEGGRRLRWSHEAMNDGHTARSSLATDDIHL